MIPVSCVEQGRWSEVSPVFCASPRVHFAAIFALGGRVVGLEVLFSPDTFAKLLPKLVQSYALDAVEIPRDHSPLPPADSAVSSLRQVATAEVREFPAVGLGKTLRLQAIGMGGMPLGGRGACLLHQSPHTPRPERRTDPVLAG